jgi:hypothetical protein
MVILTLDALNFAVTLLLTLLFIFMSQSAYERGWRDLSPGLRLSLELILFWPSIVTSLRIDTPPGCRTIGVLFKGRGSLAKRLT